MGPIKELSKQAGDLLKFFQHVSDPQSGKIDRVPELDDAVAFGLPMANLADYGGVEIDKGALLVAHRELRASGLIEVRPKSTFKKGSTEYGEVYLVRHTYH